SRSAVASVTAASISYRRRFFLRGRLRATPAPGAPAAGASSSGSSPSASVAAGTSVALASITRLAGALAAVLAALPLPPAAPGGAWLPRLGGHLGDQLLVLVELRGAGQALLVELVHVDRVQRAEHVVGEHVQRQSGREEERHHAEHDRHAVLQELLLRRIS